ncbi:MAG: ATP-binding protein [Bacteroidales bacterium]|nr:ATP-binding protein [Bacteroidales bacterium]
MIKNPFVIGKYAGPEYFCDRVDETDTLRQLITNGNNVVLTSPRRIGKTDLIRHFFAQPDITKEYIPVKVDIYSTQSLYEFTSQFGKAITNAIRNRGKAWGDKFVEFLSSLRAELTFDQNGMPVWGMGIGSKTEPNITLEEIFRYIEESKKPFLIAIDEFQQITNYSNGQQVEALLRTYIQDCNNAQFIFSGSQRHLMAEMFTSAARPFFQSARLMGLPLLKPDVYEDFCIQMFRQSDKTLNPGVAPEVYSRFDGITSYMHQVMNQLYSMTPAGGVCDASSIDQAIDTIISISADAYSSILAQLPQRQRDLLIAIASEGKAQNITSGAFIKRHNLPSPSSVSTSANILLSKDLIAREEDTYLVYDRFFAQWLRNKR